MRQHILKVSKGGLLFFSFVWSLVVCISFFSVFLKIYFRKILMRTYVEKKTFTNTINLLYIQWLKICIKHDILNTIYTYNNYCKTLNFCNILFHNETNRGGLFCLFALPNMSYVVLMEGYWHFLKKTIMQMTHALIFHSIDSMSFGHS